jgi:hypothetical protein
VTDRIERREAIKRRDLDDENAALDWPQLQCQRGDDFEALTRSSTKPTDRNAGFRRVAVAAHASFV